MNTKLFTSAFLLLFVLLGQTSTAQEVSPSKNTFALGFNINQDAQDYGLGIEAVSPYFSDGRFAFRLGVNFKWLNYMDSASAKYDYASYQNIKLGFRARKWVMPERIFVYSEGGLLFIFESDVISSGATGIGAYGLFGCELKPSENMGIFLEAGGGAARARMTKQPGEPFYGDGFMSSVGFRLNL